MAKPRVHVMFHPSGTGSLRTALAAAGRDEVVVASYDDFSFGPIGSPDRERRAAWVEAELGHDGWDQAIAQTEKSLAASLSPEVLPIAWLSRRCPRFYAGFLDWLWRIGDAPCAVIDITDMVITSVPRDGRPGRQRVELAPSLIHDREIVHNALFDRAVPLAPADRHRYQELWRRLRTENAPLRMLDGLDLVSAPITAFDPLILSCATTSWCRLARIVGAAMAASADDDRRQVSGDLVLQARALALAEAGVLEWRGDLADPRACDLRLPADIGGQ